MSKKQVAPAVPHYGAPITLSQAKKVAKAAEAAAEANGWLMVIAIVDTGANLVLLHKMDQAQTGSVLVAQQKAQSAANFRRPTKMFQDAVSAGGAGLRVLGFTNISPVEGGQPLFLDGKVIGAIGVSGAQSDEDGKVAQAGADAL